MRVTGYIIITAANEYDLADIVLQHIKSGWAPTGGIAITGINRGDYWAQAMIRTDETQFKLPGSLP